MCTSPGGTGVGLCHRCPHLTRCLPEQKVAQGLALTKFVITNATVQEDASQGLVEEHPMVRAAAGSGSELGPGAVGEGVRPQVGINVLFRLASKDHQTPLFRIHGHRVTDAGSWTRASVRQLTPMSLREVEGIDLGATNPRSARDVELPVGLVPHTREQRGPHRLVASGVHFAPRPHRPVVAPQVGRLPATIIDLSSLDHEGAVNDDAHMARPGFWQWSGLTKLLPLLRVEAVPPQVGKEAAPISPAMEVESLVCLVHRQNMEIAMSRSPRQLCPHRCPDSCTARAEAEEGQTLQPHGPSPGCAIS